MCIEGETNPEQGKNYKSHIASLKLLVKIYKVQNIYNVARYLMP